jgi:hypothetical protein
MGLPQYQNTPDLTIRTVFFVNTTGAEVTLREGMALCYDTDDTAAPVSMPSPPIDGRNLRGRRVVKPATAVLGEFAGLVSPSHDGLKVAAGDGVNVDIIVPRKGDVCFGWANANCTKNSTLLGITNAGGFNLVTHTPDAQVNINFVGIAMETVDRSVTAGKVLLRFG